MPEVGWTIRKISRSDIEAVSRILRTGGGTVKEVMNATSLSQRDAIGIISYLLATKFTDEGSKKLRSWWANAVKGKTGEVSEFSEVHKQLKEGKAADVSQIIQMLRSEVTSKEAQIGLDELGKYTSRPEVVNETGAVDQRFGLNRELTALEEARLINNPQAKYLYGRDKVTEVDVDYAISRLRDILKSTGRAKSMCNAQGQGMLNSIHLSAEQALGSLPRYGARTGETGAVTDITVKSVSLLARQFGVSENKICEIIRGVG